MWYHFHILETDSPSQVVTCSSLKITRHIGTVKIEDNITSKLLSTSSFNNSLLITESYAAICRHSWKKKKLTSHFCAFCVLQESPELFTLQQAISALQAASVLWADASRKDRGGGSVGFQSLTVLEAYIGVKYLEWKKHCFHFKYHVQTGTTVNTIGVVLCRCNRHHVIYTLHLT